jgi:hypothetical protein
MVVSFSSKKILDEIKLSINRHFRAHDETFHSALILRYIALRSILPHHSDYVWLQIHGELTDALVVHQGNCATNSSFPFGSDTLVRKFAHETGESESVANSTLAIFDNNSNMSQTTKNTQSILGKILSEWTRGIANLISGGKESASPVVIYVSASKSGFLFEGALKTFFTSADVSRATSDIMAPFVEYSQTVTADLSSSLYAVALSLSQKL